MGIFQLEEVTPKQVIVKVNADDPLTIARHPYIDANMAYITVTRGKNHILTVIRKDGSTFSFSFGASGHTVISDNLERLKCEVLQFIADQNILIKHTGVIPETAVIYYNDFFKAWQLQFEPGPVIHHNREVSSHEDMIEACRPIVEAKEWKHEIAVTGIDVWRAVNPKYKLI